MRLPDSVQEVADVIGRERALFLVGQLPRMQYRDTRFTGTFRQKLQVYVPKHLSADHPLIRLLGWDDAQRMVRAFGGEILKLATCNEIYRRFRDASILRMRREGMSTKEIAEVVGVTMRHVRNVLAEITPVEPAAANDNTQRKSRMVVAS